MKKQPEIAVHMSEDLLRRLIYLSEAEKRTPNNQILLLLRNSIAYFERSRGKLSREKLNAVDVTPYLPCEDE